MHDSSAPRPTAGKPSEPAITIDALAARTGMTVRNLREWRAMGLLPAPTMRGRSGYYDESIVERVATVQRLHADGYTLELIRRMLDAGGDLGEEAAAVAIALRAPFRAPDAATVDPLELAARWGVTDEAMFERAVELGLMRRLVDGSLEFTSARVARVGEALHRLGLSIDDTLEATAAVRTHADGIAQIFEGVWRRHVWEPFVAAGMPPERYHAIAEALAEVPQVALDAVIGLFTVAMDDQIADGIAREVARVEERTDQPG